MKKQRRFRVIWTVLAAVLVAIALVFTCYGCTTNDPVKGGESGENSQLSPEDPPSSGGEEQEQTPPAWKSDYTLPDADAALDKLIRLYGGKEQVFLLQNNQIARMPCPHDEDITINIAFEIGAYARLVLEDSVAEFNEVFATLNPHYRFTVNYAPTDEDFSKK